MYNFMATRKKQFSFTLSSKDLISIVSALHSDKDKEEKLPEHLLIFFGESMTPKEKDDFIVLSVKTIICDMGGILFPPLQLPNKTKMSRFNFGDGENLIISNEFTGIARVFKPNATISRDDVEACELVGDCIELVKKNS